jgi:ABC-type sugar transport system substrate-binding protein
MEGRHAEWRAEASTNLLPATRVECTEFDGLVAGGFFWEETDVVHAAVALGEVHAIADDELVGDFEGYVVGFDGDEAALGLVEAGGDLERRGLVL